MLLAKASTKLHNLVLLILISTGGAQIGTKITIAGEIEDITQVVIEIEIEEAEEVTTSDHLRAITVTCSNINSNPEVIEVEVEAITIVIGEEIDFT